MSQLAFYPRPVFPTQTSQCSSDDEEHGGPQLEVSDEECLRDRAAYVTPGDLGNEHYNQQFIHDYRNINSTVHVWTVTYIRVHLETLSHFEVL